MEFSLPYELTSCPGSAAGMGQVCSHGPGGGVQPGGNAINLTHWEM